MSTTKKSPSKKPGKKSAPAGKGSQLSLENQVQTVLTWLKKHGTKATRDSMARYGIPSDKAFGISVGAMRRLAKEIGRNHDLAIALWHTGWYEARVMATFVDEPAKVTPAQMDRWSRDFDSWAIVDTACFHLFDRTPYAWDKIKAWSRRRDEFGKRAAFALLASVTAHDKRADERCSSKGWLSLKPPPPTSETSSRKASIGRCVA